MANFPNPPHTVGDTHTIGNKIWTWDGEKWFADYDALVPVFQAKTAEGMVNLDSGSDFELGLDADILSELYNPTVDVIGNISVTVTSTGYGNKYVIDGVQQDSLTLTQGNTYIFDQSDSSNSGHPLRIYTDSSKSTEVTAGVTIGSDSTTFVPATTGTYSYQCSAHANMGGSITVT